MEDRSRRQNLMKEEEHEDRDQCQIKVKRNVLSEDIV